jgi:chloramphenicol 3-O phosphotransferase
VTPSVIDVPPGQVVLLNGVSSSGKSSIAQQLLVDLETPWFHMGVDMFGAMRGAQRTHGLDDAGVADVLRRTRTGFHRAVAGMARAGNDIVMDHVLSERWRLDDLLTVMAGIDVIFAGVHCAVEELERRECLRGDRTLGTAAGQIDQVHSYGDYDVEVDTTIESVATCSARISEYLRRPSAVRAFDRLRDARDRA